MAIGALSFLWMARPLLASTKKVETKPHKSSAGGPTNDPQAVQQATPSGVVVRPSEETQKAKNGTANGNKKTQPAKRRTWTQQRWQTVFTAIIAAVTAVYAIAAVFQWQVMEKSLQVSQRAYVVVQDVKADLDAGQIKITLENIGHVPAKHANVGISIIRLGYPSLFPQREWTDVEYKSPVQDLYPGTYKVQITRRFENFTPEDAVLIRAGKEGLAVACSIEYGDDFGTSDGPVFYFIWLCTKLA